MTIQNTSSPNMDADTEPDHDVKAQGQPPEHSGHIEQSIPQIIDTDISGLLLNSPEPAILNSSVTSNPPPAQREHQSISGQVSIDPTTQNITLTNFALFKNLPPYIRVRIWRYALLQSESRVVVLFTCARQPLTECLIDSQNLIRPIRLRSHVLNRVSQESRRVVHDTWGIHTTLPFFLGRWGFGHPIPPVRRTCFNPREDWLCIDPYIPFRESNILATPHGKNAHVYNYIGYNASRLNALARNVAFISRTSSALRIRWILEHVLTKSVFPMVKRIGLVCDIITLHVRPEQAWAAGLFEHGDTHALVDVLDNSRIRKFYDFVCGAAPHPLPEEARAFFDGVGYRPSPSGHPPSSLSHHQREIEKVKEAWLVAQYKKLSESDAEIITTYKRPRLPAARRDEMRLEHDNEQHPQTEGDTDNEAEMADDSPSYDSGESDYFDSEDDDELVVTPNAASRLLLGDPPDIKAIVMFRICGPQRCLTPGILMLRERCCLWAGQRLRES
ncbi:hypothetical protein F4861DRAFT_460031 [Xylaria intraflava]|nr:hypothetical protein F4861DRAFT_460031 [Xylaria intraflava]